MTLTTFAHRSNGQDHAADDWRSAPLPFRKAPHNLEAEQAVLGAILVENEALSRVASFLEPHHFFDPLHQQIYEATAKEIGAGKLVTAITLKPCFADFEPVRPGLEVWQYLGWLVANATTIINAEDYGRTIYDLATRRTLIALLDGACDAAYDGLPSKGLGDQIDTLSGHLTALRNTCGHQSLSVSRCLADIEAQPIQWLWPERFALGKLSLIAGVPGLGKSQLTCAMTAAVTTGSTWPDGTRAPLGSVVLITCEDDAADTIKPRLEAAGADTHRVELFDWAVVPGRDGKPQKRHFDVAQHGLALADLIKRLGDVQLVIIDPITAHLGKADSHVTAEVRGALAPLQTLAGETGAAIVLISHMNKNEAGGSAMNRITGSGAFVAVCRSAWLVAPDPKDDQKSRRLFLPVKNNIGDDRAGFAFTIEGTDLPSGIRTSRVVFDPLRVFESADDVLQQVKPGDEDRRSALDEACEFLRTELADGPVKATAIEAARKDADITKATLVRARKALGVKRRKEGSGKGAWLLEMPKHSQGSQQSQHSQESHVFGGG